MLATLDRTWDVATATLALPPPLPDPAAGRYDVYLAPEPSHTTLRERGELSTFDAASAFSVVDARLAPGCTLDFETARELMAAIALGAAPATDAGSVRGEATYLATLAVPCASLDAVSDAGVMQAHPDRAIVDATLAPTSSAMAFAWLDEAFATAPGRLVLALWALAPTRTPPSSPHFYGEPDGFDVMHASLKELLGPTTTFDDVLETFTADRAVAGASASSAGVLAGLPAPRWAWDIAWPDKPRALASAASDAVAPTGAAYVRIATKGHKPGARLRIDLAWEEHARMRWDVVKLDAAGRELARLPIKAADKATEAHLLVVDLDATDVVLVAGTNLGDWSAPFDPDDEAWEPHGWLLTAAAE